MPSLSGPQGPIPYTRDELGYPRLVARSQLDASWARGWFHATDRLATAQLTARIARGELMSVVGDEPLPRLLDRLVALLDFQGDLPEQVANLDDHARGLLQAYCDGFNAGARGRGKPWILRVLGLSVEEWTLEHCVLTYRLLSFFGLTSMQLSAELAVLELVADGAPEHLLHLLLGEAADALDREELGEVEIPDWLRLLHLGFMGGSNAVAVSPSRSATGSALLEGDPHLEIGRFPPLGYAVHCEIQGGSQKSAENGDSREYIQGVGVIGWPFLTSGRNQHMAWTYTYAHADHVDILVEECRDGHYRRGDDTWLPLKRREHTVAIRGKKRGETWVYWDSPYGTVVGEADRESPVRLPCIRWMGLADSGSDLNHLSKAVDSGDFEAGLEAHRNVATIAVALVGAHRDGTIGSVQTGTVDRRPDGWNGAGPWPGWTLPADKLAPEPLTEASRPCEVNPESGVFVSANVRHDAPDGALWCTLPEPSYRFDRLHQLLERKETLTLDDLARSVYDQHDLAAERFVPLWAPLLPDDPAVGRLVAWASTQPQPMDADDRQSQGLFHGLHTELVRVLVARDLGQQRADRFVDELSLVLFFQNQLDRALALELPELLDEETLRSLLADAWPRAQARMEDPDWWVPVEEPFKNLFTLGKEPALFGLSTKSFPWPGGPVSPFQTRVMNLGGERMPGGPGWRVLFDLGSHGGWYNIAGGASERRFGPGYGKGLDSWAEGRFLPLGDPEGEAPKGR